MEMSGFMPVRQYTGAGCVRAKAAELRILGSKPLVVTGRTSARISGALEDVLAAVDGPYALFDEIGQNPLLTDCMRAAELAVQEHCDYVIGIGGGSPLNAAKAIAVLAANQGMTQEVLYSLKWPKKPLPVAAVGTTAGTGSEVTKVAVITVPEGRKKSFHHEDIFPKIALGDPRYTFSLSRDFTASTAIDALAHATESYFSRLANDLSQLYALRAVSLLMPELKKILEQEDLSSEDREILYNASIYGGLAINITGTCLPHAMGYLLTEQHSLPHGYACAMFLPEFIRINEAEVPDLVQRYFAEIGVSEEEWTDIVTGLLQGIRVEITEEEIEREHGRWINNGSIKKGWGEIAPEACDEILRRISRS